MGLEASHLPESERIRWRAMQSVAIYVAGYRHSVAHAFLRETDTLNDEDRKAVMDLADLIATNTARALFEGYAIMEEGQE